MVKDKIKSLNFSNESGVTLVELLAALAILAIIVTSFLAIFIQSARTTSQASDVDEATFLAQQEMEEMVYYSSQLTFEETIAQLNSSSNVKIDPDADYSFQKSIDNYLISTSLTKQSEESTLYKVLITVDEGNTLRSQMENRLPFDGTD